MFCGVVQHLRLFQHYLVLLKHYRYVVAFSHIVLVSTLFSSSQTLDLPYYEKLAADMFQHYLVLLKLDIQKNRVRRDLDVSTLFSSSQTSRLWKLHLRILQRDVSTLFSSSQTDLCEILVHCVDFLPWFQHYLVLLKPDCSAASISTGSMSFSFNTI